MGHAGVGERSSRLPGRRAAAAVIAVVAGAILLGACGSSNTPPASTTTTALTVTSGATTTTTTRTLSGAAAAVSASWTEFFNGKTSAAGKVALLQNGSKFTSIMNDQASSGLAQSARVQVSSVTGVTDTSANVRYSIYLGSTPALPNVSGVAVRQGGTWKVSDASFCQLLNLEGVRTSACPTTHTAG
jgi:hypothetical protein